MIYLVIHLFISFMMFLCVVSYILTCSKPRKSPCFYPRVPGLSSSTSSAAPPAAAPAPAANPEPSSLSWMAAAAAAAGDGGRLSSDEGDGEPTEDNDAPACHYSDRHPQPAGVNKLHD